MVLENVCTTNVMRFKALSVVQKDYIKAVQFNKQVARRFLKERILLIMYLLSYIDIVPVNTWFNRGLIGLVMGFKA